VDIYDERESHRLQPWSTDAYRARPLPAAALNDGRYRVRARYAAWPLEQLVGAASPSTDPFALGLSFDLAGRIEAWAYWFESWLNVAAPEDSRTVGDAERAAFDAEGRLITGWLREELPNAQITYVAEPAPVDEPKPRCSIPWHRATPDPAASTLTRRFKVMADYNTWPIWLDGPDARDDVDPWALGLSSPLVGRLDAWAAWWESGLNMASPHDSRTIDDGETATYHAEGRLLAARVADELPAAQISYYLDRPDSKGGGRRTDP
jgi:hypothetical protein